METLAAPWSTRANLARLDSRPRDENEAFRFAVLGDAEPGRFWIFRKLFNVPGVFERQLRRIQGEGVDFSVQLGDMVSRGLPSHYRRLFEELARWDVRVPYLSVIGNHDRRSPHGRSDSRLYRSLIGPTNYAFDRGPARLVMLDSSDHRLSKGRLRWLDKVLGTRRIKIVFTHIPPA
ncbi:MAG: metallophosphoesterase, partial [Elusimicrobiota bacterium]